MARLRFSPALPATSPLTLGDGVLMLALVALLYAGARLALRAPMVVAGPWPE